MVDDTVKEEDILKVVDLAKEVDQVSKYKILWEHHQSELVIQTRLEPLQ